MIHAILGISGECGELLDAVKKHVIYGKPLDRENIVEELGDLYFYLTHLHQILLIPREECINANMSKLAKRYPGYNYTDQKAKERADKSDAGWIEWNGGECPVAPLTRIEARIRAGKTAIQDAEDWNWSHLPDCKGDIIAYRICK